MKTALDWSEESKKALQALVYSQMVSHPPFLLPILIKFFIFLINGNLED